MNLEAILHYLSRPARLVRSYERGDLPADLMAGLTVAVVLLPQAIAFALIVELPPAMGVYAAIAGGLIGAAWGSSNQVHTGPTNAISLLVFSTLLTVAAPGTGDFIIAAGLIAVMAGIFQLVMGLARLGALVNFVSHSVVVGFATGAAVLIIINQLRHLLGLTLDAHGVMGTLAGIAGQWSETHLYTASLGVGVILLIWVLKRVNPRLPGALMGMIVASLVVYIFRLDQQGVVVIGELPRSLPPLADLPLFNLDSLARLSTGALAVGAIGLVETAAISRTFATQTGQRLDSNQEFVGQGLSNIAAGFFSGFPVAGSFSRSAVNFDAKARTPFAAIFSILFFLAAVFLLAPLAAFLPRAALAGVLIVIALGMIDYREIVRIWQGTRDDAAIMAVTLLGTLFLHIEFAVLAGILLSFAFYIMKTSVPKVYSVLPDDNFDHFVPRKDKPPCPQLGILDILGDLYFGAVHHVEEEVRRHAQNHPEQRFLLIRMHNVQLCDISGVQMLENVRRIYQERGGDLFLVKVRAPVMQTVKRCGLYDELGPDNFLDGDDAVSYLFYRILDPAVCIYECEVRAFKECQNLPKQIFPVEVSTRAGIETEPAPLISVEDLWRRLRTGNGQSRAAEELRPLVVDVREPREFHQGHIPGAELLPLPELLSGDFELPRDRLIVLVCRGGRRSQRAAAILQRHGYKQVMALQGGMLAWEAAALLEAVDY